jgi:transglutaminase/protease-like cytokinesis protein 3
MKKTITIITLLLIISSQIFATYYYQGKLNNKENDMYISIATSLLNEENLIKIDPTLSKEQIKKVNEAIFKDLPQLFYVEQSYNFKWKEKPDGTVISSTLVYTFKNHEKGVHKTRAEVHNIVTEFINTLENLETDAQKVTLMYRYFALSRNYDISLKEDQSCYSVLINKKGVCASYARAFQYIMIYSGIECIYVTGTLDGISHAWNMVKVKGNWYNVDVTNGNSGFDDYITYQYLLIPTKAMMKSIVIDNIKNIPFAYKDNYNYYKNNELYIDSFSKKAISNRVKKAVSSGENGITFEVANSSILKKVKEYLIIDQAIYPLINKDSITYTINQERLLITIHF